MITLILVTVPIEVIFLAALHIIGWLKLPILFAIFSLGLFCCAVSARCLASPFQNMFSMAWQVWISLNIARLLSHHLWSKGLDPDMYALPIHSALMDLIGQLLLVLCFVLVSSIGVAL